ncbi:hypothetical protein BY458DRAFT_561267 [Sporodiniella umbellata]|nr:hypothetical protein BY458DRAFT_561267 [Sporodiniella umbellata]
MSKGPRSLISKQPINGKNNNGGLRLGELDKDCLLAHGSEGKHVTFVMNST